MSIEVYWVDGKRIDLNDLDLDRIKIDHIAHALAQTNRWGGRMRHPYTVAQHSVDVCLLAPPQLKYEALMHDATEAFVGDMCSDLKRQMPTYKAIERSVRRQLAYKFGLCPQEPHAIKVYDLRARDIERVRLLEGYVPMQWKDARDWFLRQYDRFAP